MAKPYMRSTLRFKRDFVYDLMRRRELPVDRITVIHRDLFAKCNVEWQDGQGMDDLLSSLNYEQLQSLQHALSDDQESDDE